MKCQRDEPNETAAQQIESRDTDITGVTRDREHYTTVVMRRVSETDLGESCTCGVRESSRRRYEKTACRMQELW